MTVKVSENYDAIKIATFGTGHVKCTWIAWDKNIAFYVQENRGKNGGSICLITAIEKSDVSRKERWLRKDA